MPNELDEWLGEGGRTLSAGQVRRLCLARVLLADVSVIVLDEPTEGLDEEAERRFFLHLPDMLAGRSAVVVSHAPMPDGVFDAHWLLDNGRLHALDGPPGGSAA